VKCAPEMGESHYVNVKIDPVVLSSKPVWSRSRVTAISNDGKESLLAIPIAIF